jgi:bifunctional DNA-binding transcriptional regulator/antitoxin component of YhaV-PrlF toxin-antitoxin module
MTVATTTLGERGLLRLPATVRDEVGVEKGDEIIVIAAGTGRIVLTTRTAIQDEVWAAAPGGGDAVTSMRAVRDADDETVAERRRRTTARAAATSQEEADRIGTSLVARFDA